MIRKEIAVIFTTVDSEEKAKEIAEKLVQSRLAACVSLMESLSLYYWEDKIEESKEYILKIKTVVEKADKVLEWLKEHHPYKVPEFIIMKAEAFGKYLNWMEKYLT